MFVDIASGPSGSPEVQLICPDAPIRPRDLGLIMPSPQGELLIYTSAGSYHQSPSSFLATLDASMDDLLDKMLSGDSADATLAQRRKAELVVSGEASPAFDVDQLAQDILDAD